MVCVYILEIKHDMHIAIASVNGLFLHKGTFFIHQYTSPPPQVTLTFVLEGRNFQTNIIELGLIVFL